MLRVDLNPFDPYRAFRSHRSLKGTARLFINTEPAELGARLRRYGAPTHKYREQDAPLKEFARGQVEVTLLRPNPPHGLLDRLQRQFEVFRTLKARRPGMTGGIGKMWKNPIKLFDAAVGFLNILRMHSDFRKFHYGFRLTGVGTKFENLELKFSTTKNIRWLQNDPSLWSQLLQMPVRDLQFRSKDSDKGETITGDLYVDLRHMLTAGLVQVSKSQDMVSGTLAGLSFAGFFFRALFQTSFWDFGAPNYPEPEEEVPTQGTHRKVPVDTLKLEGVSVPPSEPISIEVKPVSYTHLTLPTKA